MQDLQAVTQACCEAVRCNQPLALATVVLVEGSAYRRPGARMLLFPDGRRIGTVSGGCLESDVAERARKVMADGVPHYVRYDARGENGDVVFELGCKGVVGILIERATDPYLLCHLRLLAGAVCKRETGVLATVFNVEGVPFLAPGDRLMECAGSPPYGDRALPDLIPMLCQDMCSVKQSGRTLVKNYLLPKGRVGILIEPIIPPPALLLCGAGEDAVPLAALAHMAGWQVSIADPRTHLLTRERFPGVKNLLPICAEAITDHLFPDGRTAAVLMTHSYTHDLEWLRRLLPLPLAYIGLLGPRRRAEQLLAQLQEEGGRLSLEQRHRLHTPTGLDIGAETPEEIALAIVAEIQAVLNGCSGGFLRNRVNPIHATTEQEVSYPPLFRSVQVTPCPLSV